jgi:hypothetical protein
MFRALLLATLLTAALTAFSQTASDSTRVTTVQPCPAAETFAKSHYIPITGIDPISSAHTLRAGDSITALVTLTEKGGKKSQWFLYTQIAGPPADTNGVMVIYNSFGNKFEFPSFPTPVTLRTIGPFVEQSGKPKVAKIHDDTASFKLDKGYLSLGLDRAAVAIARNSTNKTHGFFASGTQPFPPEQIKKSKASAIEWNPTPDEERALGGSYPALLSYFDVVQHTEGLESIMMNVIDRPSIWNLAANLGIRSVGFSWKGARLSSVPPAAWGLSDAIPIHEIPMVLMLNDHPSLDIVMIVTAPRPPLLTSAGILGVLASKPGKTEPSLTIRIISGHLAPENQVAQ